MPDTAAATSIQQKYQRQYAADLESNRSRQEDIQEHIARLQETLGQLKADEKWLTEQVELVPARPGTTAVPRAEDGTSAPVGPPEAAVPGPRKEAGSATAQKQAVKQSPARAPKKAPAKKTAAAAATRQAAKTPAQDAAVVEKADKGAEPSLGDLLLRVLDTNPGGPRTAAEVVTGLEKAFPARARDVNTVRNTLERLVAKSRIERAKQGSTVYYSVPQESQDGAQETDTTTPAGEESEKVPAGA
ncbi:hypothetical protein ACIRU3_26070 [Streptomyces sp. NPDC101151]|uniref:hypothetical protein n=1 Tax=Streptomyces sp. NPDC101151 TaxID=3366115 RepID=UPI0037FB04CB